MVKTAILMFISCGFWCPLWWSTKWKYGYKLFSIFMTFGLGVWFSTQMISVVLNINDVTKLSLNFLTFTPALNSFCKVTNILRNRRNIIGLLNMLKDDYCKAKDQREIDIQRKYENVCRSVIMWKESQKESCKKLVLFRLKDFFPCCFRKVNPMLMVLAFVTYLCVCINPFLNNWNARVLPFLSWSPYSMDIELTFWCSYVYQIALVSIVATTCLANDILVASIMMQISGQLDVLNYRLVRFAEPNSIKSRQQSFSYPTDPSEKFARISHHPEDKRRKLVDNIHHHRLIYQ